MKPLIVMTTVVENFDARALATQIVEEHLAACVNIIPNLYSIYRWQGSVAGDYEQLLLIKTTEERLEALQATLLSRHPYEVPEFVVIPIDRLDGPYLAWFNSAVG